MDSVALGWSQGVGRYSEDVYQKLSVGQEGGHSYSEGAHTSGLGTHSCRAVGYLVSPQLARTHGSVFTLWLGSTPIVVLSGFRAVKEALVSNSEQFSGRPLTPFFQDLFGEKGESALVMREGRWLAVHQCTQEDKDC